MRRVRIFTVILILISISSSILKTVLISPTYETSQCSEFMHIHPYSLALSTSSFESSLAEWTMKAGKAGNVDVECHSGQILGDLVLVPLFPMDDFWPSHLPLRAWIFRKDSVYSSRTLDVPHPPPRLSAPS